MRVDPCRLCGALSAEDQSMRFERFGLARCEACGFQQIDPEPTAQELEDLYGALYFQKSKYTDPTAIELEYRRRHRLMRRAELKGDARLLEIGCGAGHFIETCVDRFDWHGMDLSAAGIQEARARLPGLPNGRLTAAPIEKYRPPQEGFDGILCFDTIEHVYDPATMLNRVADWLKPGGVFILSTPDAGSLMARIFGKRWPFMTPPEHLSFFTRPSMCQALAKAGLDTVHERSLGKFANLAFVVYKAGRVGILPKSFGTAARKIGLGKLTVYVPTGDVMYVIARKTGQI